MIVNHWINHLRLKDKLKMTHLTSNMKTIFKISIIIVLIIPFTNCKKDKSSPEPVSPLPEQVTSGNLKILFEGMVDTNALVLGAQTYTNQAGNAFNITSYEFFISNIKLTKLDGTVWSETNSYHLIDYSNDPSTLISITDVPFGNYKSIEFTLGVDSARNVSGAQVGALDPSSGMFWTWNQGYIMAKFEGTSPQSSLAGNQLKFHIGGFSGTNSVLKTISPSFNGDTAKVSRTVVPQIHLSNNVLEWFQTPTMIDFTTVNNITMTGASAKMIADNYSDMFTVEHIHNN